MPAAITVKKPVNLRSAVVFASPHSGRAYPGDLLERACVSELILRSSEDAYVDELLVDVPRFGATLITTEVPRAYVDFNRAEDELDPALIAGAPSAGLNPRVASGLGVLARVVANGRAIYTGKISLDEARRRLDAYWHPYHAGLSLALERNRKRFGQVLLCDVHSMPSTALDGHLARGGERPEIVLGDRWGAACDPVLIRQIEQIFRDAGFAVARNAPFAGAYIARHYGRPSQGTYVVQIEINRALYLDEERVEKLPDFNAFRARFNEALARIAELPIGGAADLAAE